MTAHSVEHQIERGIQLVIMTALLVVLAAFMVLPLPDTQRLVAIMAVLVVAGSLLSSYLFQETPTAGPARSANLVILLLAYLALAWAAQPYSLNFSWLFFIYMMAASWKTTAKQWAVLGVLGAAASLAFVLVVTSGQTIIEQVFLAVMVLTGVMAVGVLSRLWGGSLLLAHQRLSRLQAKAIQAHQADQDKTEILSLVTHQLKTPLALIRWSTEAVLHNQKMPEKEAARLRQVVVTTHTMYRTIEDLSHVFKLTSRGSSYVRWDEVVVDDLVHDLLPEYEAVGSPRQIKIIFQPARTPSKVRADRILLKHAISNLLDNALKYSHDGSTVHLSLLKNRGQLQLAVKDEGIGIEAANLGRIFHRFFRADRARQHNEHGTGLGLYLVSIIVHKMKGTVEVTSPGAGRGSTFSIFLPLLDG